MKKTYGIIYKITNVLSESVYIGQSTRILEERYSGGLEMGASNNILREDIRRYGEGVFEIEEIDVAYSRKELDDKEKDWIEYYCSNVRGNGYNIQNGGTSRSTGVVQLTLDGKYVDEFTTITEAYYKTDCLDFEISQCCMGIKEQVDRFRFIYRKDYYSRA